MYPFFKNTRKDFFDIIQPLHPKQYTVVVVYLDGYRKEYPCIENPWQYMKKIKTNPKVKLVFIK